MTHDVDSALVRKLAGLLEETGLGELEYATQDWRIRVVRPTAPAAAPPAPPPTAPAPAAAPQAAAAAPPDADAPGALKAPMVGTAYLTPDPDSPPFVAIGSVVAEGETVMIIEAMKIMNAIAAHRSGTVTAIPVVNGQPIEYGQVLLVIE